MKSNPNPLRHLPTTMKVLFVLALVASASAGNRKCYTAVGSEPVTTGDGTDCGSADAKCTKVATTGTITSFTQACALAASTDGCTDVSLGGNTVTSCFCSADLCNPASAVTGAVALLVGVFAALL